MRVCHLVRAKIMENLSYNIPQGEFAKVVTSFEDVLVAGSAETD
jgi:hypothetical protein